MRSWWSALLWRAVALAAAGAGAFAIVSTYRVFSQTFDEPAHIAAGMEWLTTGRYTYEAQHPPLARVAAAVGPYIAGERVHDSSMWYEGARILGKGDHYVRILTLARLGELPFFALLCVVVWLWGRRLTGEAGGAVAVTLVAANPNIIAHAALATTDAAPTALFAAVLLAFAYWLERPSVGRSVLFGGAVGLACVSKFSMLAFLGPSLLIGYGCWAQARGSWRLATTPRTASASTAFGVAFLTAALVTWAMYRFEIGPVVPGSHVVLPAPTFFIGALDFATHGALGHSSFLLGHVSSRGWWYYFPVVLLVKTPLPLLALGIVGVASAVHAAQRGAWEPVLLVVGVSVVMLIGMLTKVDIGVRHVLPLFPLLALLAARTVIELWNLADAPGAHWQPRHVARTLLLLGAASLSFTMIRAHPDYLAYFNPVAGAHPEAVLSDSNLDWGQDLFRLAAMQHERGIDSLRLAYFGSADPAAAGVRGARPLAHNEHATGWIAVSETYLAGAWADTGYVWLRPYQPVARVGRSMRLYWLPPLGASR
jgi:4-amino-4-deoxy-L-arabinose transferase-like glycosyltransferase